MNFLLAASLLVLNAWHFAGPPKSETASPTPQRLALWNGHAPVGAGKFEGAEAWITVHQPAAGNGTAIVICPGGGYGTLVTGPEGHGIAKWLNRHGITGVVLERPNLAQSRGVANV